MHSLDLRLPMEQRPPLPSKRSLAFRGGGKADSCLCYGWLPVLSVTESVPEMNVPLEKLPIQMS